jgi:hypothetical protein
MTHDPRIRRLFGSDGKCFDVALDERYSSNATDFNALLSQIKSKNIDCGILLDPIPNRPYFTTVDKERDIDVSLAAKLAWHAIENHFGYGVRKSTTTELKVNYLRPIGGKRVTARAHLVRAGQRLCVSRVDIFDDKKNLGAIAIVTYMLL